MYSAHLGVEGVAAGLRLSLLLRQGAQSKISEFPSGDASSQDRCTSATQEDAPITLARLRVAPQQYVVHRNGKDFSLEVTRGGNRLAAQDATTLSAGS